MSGARRTILLALALAALALVPASAHAAPPRGFFGVTFDRQIALEAPNDVRSAEYASMKRARVESARVQFRWDLAQKRRGGPFDYRTTDVTMIAAARQRMPVLALLMYAPGWARIDPSNSASPPRDPAQYAQFVRQMVRRYGPRGSFWRAHPELPRVPVRDWQVWNEPSLRFQWDAPNWQRGYGRLLRAANRAIKSVDRRARTVLAGLPNRVWEDLESLYRQGHIKGAFDVASIHVYTAAVVHTIGVAEYVVDTLRRHGDRRKQVWYTEIGVPATLGRAGWGQSIGETDDGMATFLRRTYTALARRRYHGRQLVHRVYWYTWASSYSGDDPFSYVGLRRFDGDALSDRPALSAFSGVARSLRR